MILIYFNREEAIQFNSDLVSIKESNEEHPYLLVNSLCNKKLQDAELFVRTFLCDKRGASNSWGVYEQTAHKSGFFGETLQLLKHKRKPSLEDLAVIAKANSDNMWLDYISYCVRVNRHQSKGNHEAYWNGATLEHYKVMHNPTIEAMYIKVIDQLQL